MTDIDLLRRSARILFEKGQQAKSDAGYSGEMGDRGGGAMMREAQAFLAGLEKRLPAGRERHLQDAEKEVRQETARRDPEWAEYERLKTKFENQK